MERTGQCTDSRLLLKQIKQTEKSRSIFRLFPISYYPKHLKMLLVQFQILRKLLIILYHLSQYCNSRVHHSNMSPYVLSIKILLSIY